MCLCGKNSPFPIFESLRMKMKRYIGQASIAAAITIAIAAALRLGAGEADGAKIVASGAFHQVAHKGRGVATIYQLPDTKLVLRLTDFHTDSGRDLQVYLISALNALENETVQKSEFVSLGELRKSEGDQSYELPAGLDLTKYRAVTVWNRKYQVNFITAPLTLR